jgi:Na+/H+-dicarboxylate symporter
MIIIACVLAAWIVLAAERKDKRRFGGMAYVTLIAFSIVTLVAVAAAAQRGQNVSPSDLYRTVSVSKEQCDAK